MVLRYLELRFPLPQVSRLALSGLRNWTAAASPSAVFSARHFQPFLPPPGQELGEPWWIIPSELSVFTGYLSNNRFYPPPPKGKEVRTAGVRPEALCPSPGVATPLFAPGPQCQACPTCSPASLWTCLLPMGTLGLWVWADPTPVDPGSAGPSKPTHASHRPQVIIHRLLSMFHPRPFVKTRFAPQGAVACLTAISDFYYTVMFR